ncbi:MAG: DUF2752 domain-containing protein [Pseudomonadota bacterium]
MISRQKRPAFKKQLINVTNDKRRAAGFRFFEGWGILAGASALFVVAYLFPRIPVLPKIDLCAARHFLGVPCPGCGLTRSFVAFVHGNLRASIDVHPLGAVIAVWLIYMMGRSVAAAIMRRRPPELLTQQGRDWILAAFLVGLIVQWIARLSL